MATSQKDQIQSLIADIERALGKERPKTPWVKTSETEPQREALARAQAYLMSLQQSFDAPGGWGPVDPTTGQIASQSITPAVSAPASDASAENVLQALLTEMKFLKSSALEPLRLEMDSLREERDRLNNEVKTLAEQRNQVQLETQQAQLARTQQLENASAVVTQAMPQAIDEDQLNQFLQVLMARLQENLSMQVTDTLGQLETEHAAAMAKLTAATEVEILELKPTGQMEEMRQLQSRSDQLLANIDSTLQGMFETLQTNIDGYQVSLSDSIDNMHSLGRQGEGIVRSLVDHLTQQLGQTVPPEPAFYPGRANNTLAEATDVTSAEPTADTVSSLNEILPAASGAVAGGVALQEMRADAFEPSSDATDFSAEPTVFSDAATSVDRVDSSEKLAAQLIAEEGEEAPDSDVENFIREDGTIDLDLLKLDIDRTEDDLSLSRDDLMIDSAVADAQVADQSSDSSAIEEKVKPTADAAFLADLTFDDLVIDPVERSQVRSQDLEVTPDLELAAVLPDLSFSDGDTDSAASETSVSDDASRDEASDPETSAATEDVVEDTDEGKPESALVPDLPDANEVPIFEMDTDTDIALSDDLIAVIESANEDAARTALEAAEGDLDELASDLEESVVFDADLPPLSVLGESATPLESASIPDQPDGSTAQSFAQASDQAQVSSEATQFPPDTDSKTTQLQPIESLDASLTDLDSPDDSFERNTAALEDSSEGLPHSSTFEELEELINDNTAEADLLVGAVDAQSSLPTVTELPPVAFDDDLDFFPSEPPIDNDLVDTPVADTAFIVSPAEDAVLPISDLSTAAAGLAGAVGVGAVAEGLTTASEESTSDSQSLEAPADDVDDPQGPITDEGDDDPTNGEPADWFLGVDFGATGLSAVLINQRGEQVYPLCWNISDDSEANRFRLPTVVQLNTTPSNGYQLGQVGPAALGQAAPLLRNLKLMVKAGIPDDTASAPWMQWADNVTLPLVSLQSAIVELLKTLNAEDMSCRAVGLTANALRNVLSDLKGVVIGYPTNWPDTYSFNVREAVLAAGLVSSPDQVFFVEEAIAALLSALPAPKVAGDIPENQQPGLYNCNWSGGTVVISAGAVLTETAVANLPSELDQLSYQDFVMRGYTYAGDGIDQDIICQLLHLPLQAQDADLEDGAGPSNWANLGLNEIPLPQPGEADRVVRHRLRQRLNDSPLGREAVLAARELKVALQEEEEVEVELGDRTWIVTRKDIESKVFLPYIQRINRQVNALLSKQNLLAENVKQVVCTGGSASLGAIARWLRQKFPNATIIQDTYSGEYSNSCSRVAYGLANLCQYPDVLDSHRHQYNDYFLLLELLRILPEQPLPAGGILHLLEQRGINTQACQAHVLALIEGHLPPGLVPTSGDRPLISAQSSDIATYKMLSELPLFRKQGGQIYIADPKQGERLRSHLENLLSTKAQSLIEPMTTETLTAASTQA